MTTTSTTPEASAPHLWSAVLAMALCVAMLITSEFMPVSLLTPMAEGLGATTGQTGQAISISGLFAVLASLLTTTLAGGWNRKWVLVAMTTLMLISLAMIAMAPNFAVLMLARALLGITIGGFWSLATAVIMRLVPPQSVSRALAIMYTGQASAAAFAAPIGSFLGDIIGWRGVFFLLVPIVALNILWLLISLPSLPARSRQSFAALFDVLRRGYFLRGLGAVIANFAGAFSMFTYLRPFLETVTGVEVTMLSTLFLVLGVAGFAGTWIGGRFGGGHLNRLLLSIPTGMGLTTAGLLLFGHNIWIVAICLAIWGALNTIMSIAWMLWIATNVDDAPEAAGSLMVGAIQAAILCGAALGGVILDQAGITGTFGTSIALLALSIALIGSGRRISKPA